MADDFDHADAATIVALIRSEQVPADRIAAILDARPDVRAALNAAHGREVVIGPPDSAGQCMRTLTVTDRLRLDRREEPHRIAAWCGAVVVGVVFPRGGRRPRWRVWVTKTIHPVEGVSRDIVDAQRAVEDRFFAILDAAGLTFDRGEEDQE